MNLTPKEKEMFQRTGTFLTVYKWTISGEHMRGFVFGMAVMLFVLLPVIRT